MAIEALEDFSTQYARLEPIINACKEALEQPAQEPVGFVSSLPIIIPQAIRSDKNEALNIPLYTHPHQWQGLTDDDVIEICSTWNELNGSSYADLCRAIEQALKEKNT